MKNKKSTMIICEKPAAAAKIAAALSDGKDEKITNKDKVSYYEFDKGSKHFIVGCAVGHLFGIQQVAARGPFPNFEVEWKPAYERKGSAFTKRYYSVLKKLAKQSDEFIIATDYDVEGEVIGWNVLRFIAKQKDAKRMKFSSLTKEELDESFENLAPSLNWGSAIAGETRHYLDWFYGINLSRGLMKALSNTGQFRILSIGRVQGPALKIVVDKEKEIQAFKSEPYWQIFLQIQDKKKKKLEVKYPRDIKKKSDLLKFQHLKGKKGEASTEIKEEKLDAPKPFDLTTLQTEAYKFHGLTPSQTLRVAQKLYLGGMISYPRTSSQKYPANIGYDKIMKRLKKYTQLVKHAVNKTPTEGKKEDPAHPAIYPTGEFKKIAEGDKKIYDLIVKRFISCFCDKAEVENKKVVVDVDGLKFNARGLQVKEKNWLAVYPTKLKEEKIPTIEGEVDVKEIRTEEKETKPPRRYSAASLVRELEKKNLGTKATRASIIETLYSRGYVQEKSVEVTELGMRMAETLEKYSPLILDEDLTREMEKELEKIQKSDKDLEKKEEKILNKAKKSINGIAKDMTKNLESIGKSLADANAKVWEKEKQASTMTVCPVCNKGRLRVMYGRKFKRYFVSCDAYPKCKTTYSLPPNGMMKPALNKEGENELCQEEKCGFPLITSLRKGKRPWKFCFNPECKSNEEWVKKKEEFLKKQKKTGKKVVKEEK
jgi:DNA topoisomerase I